MFLAIAMIVFIFFIIQFDEANFKTRCKMIAFPTVLMALIVYVLYNINGTSEDIETNITLMLMLLGFIIAI